MHPYVASIKTLFEQNGALGFAEQSLSSAHATQRPVAVSHAEAPGLPRQWMSAVHGWQANPPPATPRQSGRVGSVQPASPAGVHVLHDF